MGFPPLGNSDHVVSVSINFSINLKQSAALHHIAYDYSCADLDGLHDHLGDVWWEQIFEFSASAATSEFCEWVQVEINVYILHCKNQVKPHSFPWFSAACSLPWFIEITFLNCTSRIILLNLKQSSDRLVIIAKGLWKLPNLHILLKQKDFGKFLIVFSTKINLPYLLYSTGRRHWFLHLIKANCLLNIFVISLILMTQVSFHLFSLLELVLTWIILS